MVAGTGVALVAACLVGPGCREMRRMAEPDGGAAEAGQPDAGSDGGICAQAVPETHRATALACSMTRPFSPDGGDAVAAHPGECMTDSDCFDGGINGRCVVSSALARLVCSYDECFTDADCADAGGVCSCRDHEALGANICVPAGCHIDSDCGACGYCSPVTGGCSPHIGVVSYECHTAQDQCTNDSDCDQSVAGLFCIFDPAKAAYWLCGPSDCSG
jgi:hypothetical protein